MKFEIGDWVKIVPEPHQLGRVAGYAKRCHAEATYRVEIGNERDWWSSMWDESRLVLATEEEKRDHGGDRV